MKNKNLNKKVAQVDRVNVFVRHIKEKFRKMTPQEIKEWINK